MPTVQSLTQSAWAAVTKYCRRGGLPRPWGLTVPEAELQDQVPADMVHGGSASAWGRPPSHCALTALVSSSSFKDTCKNPITGPILTTTAKPDPRPGAPPLKTPEAEGFSMEILREHRHSVHRNPQDSHFSEVVISRWCFKPEASFAILLVLGRKSIISFCAMRIFN